MKQFAEEACEAISMFRNESTVIDFYISRSPEFEFSASHVILVLSVNRSKHLTFWIRCTRLDQIHGLISDIVTFKRLQKG